jgi:hypothetical protein
MAEIRSLLAATGAPALQQGSVTGIGIPAIDALNKAARFQYEYEDQPVRTWGSPLTVLSQYLPIEYEAIRQGALENDAAAIIGHRIRRVLRFYGVACGAPAS